MLDFAILEDEISYDDTSSLKKITPEQKQSLIDYRGDQNDSLLHLAAFNGALKCCQMLLDLGLNINAKDREGDTPLISAIDSISQHDEDVSTVLEITKLFINNNAKLDADNYNGQTALHFAAETTDAKEIINLLAQKGAKLDVATNYGDTPLHYAVSKGNIENTQLLLLKKLSPDTPNEYGFSALDIAVKMGNQNLVELLLDADADINRVAWRVGQQKALLEDGEFIGAEREFFGWTSLDLAINNLDVNIIELLLKNGASIDFVNNCLLGIINSAKDKYKNTDEFNDESIEDEYELFNTKKKIFQLLIKYGFDITKCSKYFQYILLSNQVCLAEYLLEKGVQFNYQHGFKLWQEIYNAESETASSDEEESETASNDEDELEGETASSDEDESKEEVIAASKEDSVNLSEEESSSEEKIFLNYESNYYSQLLHKAVAKSYDGVVEFLLDRGFDVNERDCFDYTPLHYAKTQPVAELLIEHGAEINPKPSKIPAGEYYNSPLYNAVCIDIADSEIEKKLSEVKIERRLLAEYLLRKGADVNAKGGNGGVTPLSCALEDLAMMRILLDYNADVNSKCTRYGRTVLHEALDSVISANDWPKVHLKCAEILLENGANMYIKDNCGRMPFEEILNQYADHDEDGQAVRALYDTYKDKCTPPEESQALTANVKPLTPQFFSMEQGRKDAAIEDKQPTKNLVM